MAIIYVEDNDNKADVKVFVVDQEYKADLCVFIESKDYRAKGDAIGFSR